MNDSLINFNNSVDLSDDNTNLCNDLCYTADLAAQKVRTDTSTDTRTDTLTNTSLACCSVGFSDTSTAISLTESHSVEKYQKEVFSSDTLSLFLSDVVVNTCGSRVCRLCIAMCRSQGGRVLEINLPPLNDAVKKITDKQEKLKLDQNFDLQCNSTCGGF